MVVDSRPLFRTLLAMLHTLVEACWAVWCDLELLLNAIRVGLAGPLRRRPERDRGAHRGFRRAKDATYRDLWVMLERLYWTLREHDTDQAMLRRMLHEVNFFVMENFLYLRPADQVLVGRYLLALHRMNALSSRVAAMSSDPTWEDPKRPPPRPFANVDVACHDVTDLRNQMVLIMSLIGCEG